MKNIAENKIATTNSLEIDLSLIDEDPDQPRTEFDPVTLQELADTIRLRGVKTPISVHPSPVSEGRFIINHGARRYRASILAKKKTIPAFIDTDYSNVDQVIENLQRDNLTPREIANFIGYQYSKGFKNREIAKMIGKTPSFVSLHHSLLNLPNPVADVFETGKTRDVMVINSLANAFKEAPEIVIDWLNNPEQEITRGSVELLRQFIKIKNKKTTKNKSDAASEILNKAKKVEQDIHSIENAEKLLPFFSRFYENIDLRKNISVETLSHLTTKEQMKLLSLLKDLSSLLNKLNNPADN